MDSSRQGEISMSKTVQVGRAALDNSRIVEEPLAPLGEGEVRLKVESFAVTANNVTYAVAGDAFGYWNFFPGQGDWGVVPMWGHAVVTESAHPGIAVGERAYGYLPMAEYLDVLPVNVTPGGFTDAAAHRQPMSPIYNRYSRLAADPEHDPAREGERMVFGPLFRTGFMIEYFMRREGWFGAEQVVITSASSKTAMGMASVVRQKSPHIPRIGLTSQGNLAFVRASGFYDAVLSYDQIDSLPQVRSVSVDFAGNSELLHRVHSVLGGNLKYSCTVGATHVGKGFGQANSALPGPAPVLFFAPDHIVAAMKELGPKAFGDDVAVSWRTFLDDVDSALRIDERDGLEAARDAFADTLAGRADPAVGIVVRP